MTGLSCCFEQEVHLLTSSVIWMVQLKMIFLNLTHFELPKSQVRIKFLACGQVGWQSQQQMSLVLNFIEQKNQLLQREGSDDAAVKAPCSHFGLCMNSWGMGLLHCNPWNCTVWPLAALTREFVGLLNSQCPACLEQGLCSENPPEPCWLSSSNV